MLIWASKSPGRRVRGGGCFGCLPIPIGCGVFVLAAMIVAVAAAM